MAFSNDQTHEWWPSEADIDNAGMGIKREVDLTVTAVNDSKIRVE